MPVSTPFSSAFWSVLHKKIIWSKIYIKISSPHDIHGWKEIWVNKIFGSNNILGLKKIWVQRMLGVTNYGS